MQLIFILVYLCDGFNKVNLYQLLNDMCSNINIYIENNKMKVKTYGLFEGDKEIVLVYSNPSQKDFLDF